MAEAAPAPSSGPMLTALASLEKTEGESVDEGSPPSSPARPVSSINAEGEHELQSEWSFWYNDMKTRRPSGTTIDTEDYQKHLHRLGTVGTVEGFYKTYRHLSRPSQLNRLASLALFRGDVMPLWENYEDGGHWLVTIGKKQAHRNLKDGKEEEKEGEALQYIDALWEQLVLALIGESFEEPMVVGVVVQARPKEDVLSVWLSAKSPKFRVGERLKSILQLQPSTVIEYKLNKSSMKDASGVRNATAYRVGDAEAPAAPAAEAPAAEAAPASA